MNEVYHIPALQRESIEGLNIQPDGIYVDATFGGGGHSLAILQHLSTGKLFAFDQDPNTQHHCPQHPQFQWIYDNFSQITSQLKKHHVHKVHGILADLGVSFHQFDQPHRGFSFRFEDALLDMRMNPQTELTAATILNEYPEAQLAHILQAYGELHSHQKLAHHIAQYRIKHPIQTVKDLLTICKTLYTPHTLKKLLPQIFQALRIEVNQELEHLKKFLSQTYDLLHPHGRLVILSYHSLEDRIVKNFFKTGNVEGIVKKDFFGKTISLWKVLTPKPITPQPEEIQYNPRCRSAKLRIAEKI